MRQFTKKVDKTRQDKTRQSTGQVDRQNRRQDNYPKTKTEIRPDMKQDKSVGKTVDKK